MKKLLVLIFLTISAQANENKIQVLMLDSSFPPLKKDGFDLVKNECLILSENEDTLPEKGSCFDEKLWSELEKNNKENLIEGMMDFLSKKDSDRSKKYQNFEKQNPQEAKKIRTNYILMSHGTRSAYVLHNHASPIIEILPMRVVTAQAGTTKQADLKKSSSHIEVYGNGCNLKKWAESEIKSFNKSELLHYQKRIQKVIDTNKNLKIVSISLGYKKNWIAEDNSKCNQQSVDLEYQILKNSWSNLIKKNPNVIFIVAAGNENENFDLAEFKNNDLWADLSEINNLILVGSLKKDGSKFESSNYGQNVIMTKGEFITSLSPVPQSKSFNGHETTLRGTSFSAPIIAGLVSKIIEKNPNINIAQLRSKLKEEAKLVH